MIGEIHDHGAELVVFINELHTVLGAEAGKDAANLLRPAFFHTRRHIIGATTPREYHRTIENISALVSRFQPVPVPEPSVPETVEILRGLRARYEQHHRVRITDEALTAAAQLSERHLPGRVLPDKAIDLVDQAGARAQLHAPGRAGSAGVPEVDARTVAEVVSRATGIRVGRLVDSDRDRLRRLEADLAQRVIGQDDAVAAVAEAIRRSRAGLAGPARPVGSFLFLGPTGVGKTELARALADCLFGDETRLVRLDLSGFSDAAGAVRLIGKPAGYTTQGEAGQLTEEIRRRPYSVLLLDQVDKAHTDVFAALQQVLDDGRLTDGLGRTVDFRNTVVVMTSSVAAEVISATRSLGFGAKDRPDDGSETQHRVRAKLRERFRPEFLNRVDEVVAFRPLGDGELRRVTGRLLAETEELLRGQDITVEVRPAALDWLAERGHQPEAGARRMRRAIRREIDNRLSALLLDGDLRPGQHVTVQASDGPPTFTVTDRSGLTAAGPTGEPGQG